MFGCSRRELNTPSESAAAWRAIAVASGVHFYMADTGDYRRNRFFGYGGGWARDTSDCRFRKQRLKMIGNLL
jgi:hypothetical protein